MHRIIRLRYNFDSAQQQQNLDNNITLQLTHTTTVQNYFNTENRFIVMCNESMSNSTCPTQIVSRDAGERCDFDGSQIPSLSVTEFRAE